MNRREFLERSGLTGIGIFAGLSVLGSLEIPTIRASVLPASGGIREIPLLLADTPELQQVGGMYHLDIDELEKNLIVARTGDSTFVAVDIKCTHKGCDVAYNGKNLFVCPCHGSEYSLKGEVSKGPSTKPLHSYETSFADGTVTVKIPTDPDDLHAPAPGAIDSSKVPKDSSIKK